MSRRLPLNARSEAGSKAGRRKARRQREAPTDTTSNRSFLSAADAAFLYLERKEIPLAIACVTIFDGPIPFEPFVASVAAKLHLVPRYRQVVVSPPLNIEMPSWQEDAHFDIRRHIFHVTLEPPGGKREMEALAGRIFSQVLDRSKPLWEMYVVDGLKEGRGAQIWRVHHALADGISGTHLLEVFLDGTPDGSPAPPRPNPAPPVANERSTGRFVNIVQNTLDSMLATERGLLDIGQALLGHGGQNGAKSLLNLLPELLLSVERLPFNKPCSEGRKFCWTEIEMTEVKKIRQAIGGRVNDVILTLLTRALARYVKLHGQSTVNRLVRIVCPVSLRQPGREESLGNQISFLLVALPLDVRDPAETLRAVAARTETMKRSGAAALVGIAAACIAKAPPPLQALFWWGLPELILPMPLFNMICTNIPGPPAPLYAVGRRMVAAYPQVPTGYDLGINCAVESYDGKLFFGLIADARAGSDVDRLRDFIHVAYRELCEAARKIGSSNQSARARKRPPRKPRAKSQEQVPASPGEQDVPTTPASATAPEASPAA